MSPGPGLAGRSGSGSGACRTTGSRGRIRRPGRRTWGISRANSGARRRRSRGRHGGSVAWSSVEQTGGERGGRGRDLSPPRGLGRRRNLPRRAGPPAEIDVRPRLQDPVGAMATEKSLSGGNLGKVLETYGGKSRSEEHTSEL